MRDGVPVDTPNVHEFLQYMLYFVPLYGHHITQDMYFENELWFFKIFPIKLILVLLKTHTCNFLLNISFEQLDTVHFNQQRVDIGNRKINLITLRSL